MDNKEDKTIISKSKSTKMKMSVVSIGVKFIRRRKILGNKNLVHFPTFDSINVVIYHFVLFRAHPRTFKDLCPANGISSWSDCIVSYKSLVTQAKSLTNGKCEA